TGQHDAVEPRQVLFGAYEARARAAGFERPDVLGESPLHREDPDEGKVFLATSPWQRAARPSGWWGSRFRASPSPTPWTPRPARPACRSTWSRPRSPWHASRGPRT